MSPDNPSLAPDEEDVRKVTQEPGEEAPPRRDDDDDDMLVQLGEDPGVVRMDLDDV